MYKKYTIFPPTCFGSIHKIQQDVTVYQNFVSYLYEAQHVLGDTPPIIRSLKLLLAASGFAYMEGCRTCGCWTLSTSSNYMLNNPRRIQNQRLLVQF
jgi:hypothetical protein